MKAIGYFISSLSILYGLTACGGSTSHEDKSDTLQAQNENGKSFVAKPREMEEQQIGKLGIGDAAPHFKLPDVRGKFWSLDDFKEADVLVVNFTCNHCPTAQAYEDRFIQVVEDYKDKGVAFVAISPNSPIAILPEELGYTELSDSYEEMKIRAKDKQYNFPYLYDGDEHRYSLAYGPTATPHVFVFDKSRKLSYSGRIDSSEKPGTGNAEDLRLAIEETLAGRALPNDQAILPAFGCSIKWAWKNEYTKKVNAEWNEKPVELTKISLAELAELLRNGSEELLLLNFWATWCGPCIVEYPEFIEIQRMYGDRDFRFVSISLDDPGEVEKVLKFLKKKHAATINYLVDEKDKYEIIRVVKNDWEGNLPLTLLIEPGGKVVYKVPGPIDPLALKRAIIDHPIMGRYY